MASNSYFALIAMVSTQYKILFISIFYCIYGINRNPWETKTVSYAKLPSILFALCEIKMISPTLICVH